MISIMILQNLLLNIDNLTKISKNPEWFIFLL